MNVSLVRRIATPNTYDLWRCGGVRDGRMYRGVWYCGESFPVPSMANDCEHGHEELAGADIGAANGRSHD